MKLKTLTIDADLHEKINFHSHVIPLVSSTSKLDEYQNQEWQCHWHNEFEFALVIRGCVEYQVFAKPHQSQKIQLNVGEGIFINTGRLHSVRALETSTIMQDFAFSPNFFEIKAFENFARQSIQPIMSADIDYWLISKDERNRSLLEAISTLCNIQTNEFGYELHTIEMVCRIWRLLSQQILTDLPSTQASTRQTIRIKKALSYIHTHFEESITVEDILHYAGISRTECFRVFQNILNKTPMQYVIEYRLAMAASLLTNSQRTLADIATSCGFQTPSYFGKQFRKHYGITPKQFRNKGVEPHQAPHSSV